MKTVPQLTVQQAQAAANLFLSDHLPDRFTAAEAQLSATGDAWKVTVSLSYPFIGSLGYVGEILVSTASDVIVSHTPFDDMRQAGQELYAAHRNEIEANFP